MTAAAAPHQPIDTGPPRHGAWQVFWVFLQLGLTSFGGPVAHLGYFRQALVVQRQWLTDAQYADLVGLCQFLPGPASSQVGMALGLMRAGWRGCLAAWLGFTMPSAVALMGLAAGLNHWPHLADSAIVHGLKLVAVAVVAHAVWGMWRNLCKGWLRKCLAVGSAILLLAWPGAALQVLVLAMGGLVGWRFLRAPPGTAQQAGPALSLPLGRTAGLSLLLLCGLLLLCLPVAAQMWPNVAMRAFAAFYQAGALVFGGGHVVLPLLQASVVSPGWVSDAQFLTGYAAAQAVPGPLFTLAAYLGALLALPAPWAGWAGGLLMLAAIFLPAFLLVAGALPWWQRLRENLAAQRALAGINAAVVGVLLAAFVHPVWTSAIRQPSDACIAAIAFALLQWLRVPPVVVVLLTALAAWGMQLLHNA
ncbi:chromate transporter [Comamonas odontotermitis]|uniref:Chromate transporter n=1 Tax=Comamonas odontotermitis TaxID=379895 RepID=A0ABR6RI19_9BURK|nr:chromate efflux transporter [Comamonas odontotermitis]MBB6578815.1 chromate transporter [Comamonas odontotermitis]